MREPRPRQRLPEGGLEIYEKRKAGLWNGADLLMAYPEGYVSPRWGRKPKAEILRWGYTLIYQPHFDPMLYFWPVEDFCVPIHVDNHDSDHTKKLVRAMLRDGAQIVTTYIADRLSSSTKFYDQESGWKKPSQELEYHVPPPSKKTRMAMIRDAIRDEDAKR